MDFSEQFNGSMDEFFTYPVMSPIMEPYNDDVAFTLQGWQEQVVSDSVGSYASTPPSLTLSRSSSLPSDTVDSPVLGSPLPDGKNNGPKLRLTWPGEGQHPAQNEHAKKPTVSASHSRSYSIASTTSAEDVMPVDPHHEGSCAKCRMTEAEARKCRLERRREQNRASQRKFRARKEAKIREAASQVATLETYVEFLEKHNGDLEATNAELRQQISNFEKTQRARPNTPTGSAAKDDSPSISQSNTSSLPASKKASTTNAISAAQRQGMDLYLPLFDHELEPHHPYSNTR